jgi:hypothetical protein
MTYRPPATVLGPVIRARYRFCSTLVSPAQPDQTNQRWPSNTNMVPSTAHLSSGSASRVSAV